MSYSVHYEKSSIQPEYLLVEDFADGMGEVIGKFFREDTARACAKWLEERKHTHGSAEESHDHH